MCITLKKEVPLRSIVIALAFALGVIGCSLASAEESCTAKSCRRPVAAVVGATARVATAPVRVVLQRAHCHRHRSACRRCR